MNEQTERAPSLDEIQQRIASTDSPGKVLREERRDRWFEIFITTATNVLGFFVFLWLAKVILLG